MSEPAAGPRRTGLLVDWAGVITTDPFASFATFETREGLAAQAVNGAFRTDAGRNAMAELERGAITEADFATTFGPLLPVADTTDLIGRIFGDMTANEPIVEAVRRARAAGVPTGLVSNSWGEDRYDEALIEELFDGVVISGAVGLRKPDPEIYRLGAESIDRAPEQCVFVDDLGRNLKAAAALGMATVRHTDDPEATIARLQELLGVALR